MEESPDRKSRLTTRRGYPVRSLRDVPPGEYYVQALLYPYKTFHRFDGKTVKLPMDHGEGHHWNIAPGSLYSKSMRIAIGKDSSVIKIVRDREIPPIPEPADTKFVRHIKIQSELLTKFWGRPIYLSAVVLVPYGFDEHPDAHYPLMLFHDHFVSHLAHDNHTHAADFAENAVMRNAATHEFRDSGHQEHRRVGLRSKVNS
jgi:hypothetical protein